MAASFAWFRWPRTILKVPALCVFQHCPISLSVDKCNGFRTQAIEALRRVSLQITTLRIIDQHFDQWVEQQISLLCNCFPNLKTFEFGFVFFERTIFGPISNLSQMENLKLSFKYCKRQTNWMQNLRNMRQFFLIKLKLN
jgi:hypothetical protein